MTFSTSAVAVCCCSDSRKILGARLHLVEQPHVLDRDHGLVGECLDELNLSSCKGLHDLARQRKNADRFALAPQGDTEISSVAAKSLVFEGEIALRLVGKQVLNLDYAPGRSRASGSAGTADR